MARFYGPHEIGGTRHKISRALVATHARKRASKAAARVRLEARREALARSHRRLTKVARKAAGTPDWRRLRRRRGVDTALARVDRLLARRNPKGKPRMARKRRTRKQMAAFRRMVAGLRRWKSGHARKRKKSRARRRRNPARAAGRSLRPVQMVVTSRANGRKRKRRETMARRRRRRTPATHTHRRRRRRSNGRRHIHRRHRRHNPGLSAGGAIKSLGKALIPAAAGGLAAGLLDARVTGAMSAPLRVGAKLAVAALGGALLRKNPLRAAAFVGAMVGTAAYEAGVRVGGGVIAVSKAQGMHELAALAAEDDENLGLLHEELAGMGLLTDMSGDDDEMGDIEPDLGDVTPDLGDGEELVAMSEFGDDDDS